MLAKGRVDGQIGRMGRGGLTRGEGYYNPEEIPLTSVLRATSDNDTDEDYSSPRHLIGKSEPNKERLQTIPRW